MQFRWDTNKDLVLRSYILKWLCFAVPTGAIIGSICALFLWTLQRTIQIRLNHPWLLFLLPVAGAAISFLYTRFGGSSDRGNNVLIEAINRLKNNDGSIVVPRRMAPIIVMAALITHLFGGSAGREGTAIQMGGSVASAVGRLLHLDYADTRLMLMAGMAAGFGGIFGTPLAGAVFATEVQSVRHLEYDALVPCFIASIISSSVCNAWGITRVPYSIAAALGLSPISLVIALKVAVAAVAFGLAGVLFIELTHGVSRVLQRTIARPIFRPMLGGVCVIALVYLLGTRDYLSLGIFSTDPRAVTTLSSFAATGAGNLSWWWKTLFTAISLGSGFRGGIVTPLFFIGATLGNVIGRFLIAPPGLFPSLGLVAVFAAVSNAPLTCTLMGLELFGSHYAIYFIIACFGSYLFSGNSRFFLSQRIDNSASSLRLNRANSADEKSVNGAEKKSDSPE